MSHKDAIDLALEVLDASPPVREYIQILNSALQAGENHQSQRILSELERLAALDLSEESL